MYCSYFGFREKPFTITPNPQFIFLSKNHKEAFAHLLYGIDNHAGFIELTGEVGTGKTTVLRTLLNQLDSDSYRTALIFNPSLSALELLQNINHEYGIPSDDQVNSRLLDSLNRFLLRENAAGRTVVLVIDEAQNLEPQVLEQIRLISNLETERDKLIQIVLVGQPELREKLRRSELRQLSQRIMVRYHLCPMDYADTVEYIEHRLEVAGGRRLDIFTPGALKQVFRYSGGLPRLINVVCDRALLVAYTKGTSEITARMAAEAIADVKKEVSPFPVRRFARFAGIAAVAMLAFFGLFTLMRGLPGVGERSAPDDRGALTEKRDVQLAETASSHAIREILAKQTEGESVIAAFNSLARAWGVQPVAQGKDTAPLRLEDLAARSGLRVSRFTGNLGALLRMDYPAILEMTLPAGGKRYLALLGTDNGNLLLSPQPRERTSVSSREVEGIWSGRSYFLWKNTLNIPAVTKTGTSGESIRTLKKLLRGAGFYQGPVNDVFDEAAVAAVRRFQAANGLEPDGMVGNQTLLLLYRAGGMSASPRLVKKGES
jgi:general secretion pathway protein A